jgi:hypothetical protein
MENVGDVSDALITYHFFALGNHGLENSRNIAAAGTHPRVLRSPKP